MSAGSLDFELTPWQVQRREDILTDWTWGSFGWDEISQLLQQLERYEARVRELMSNESDQ